MLMPALARDDVFLDDDGLAGPSGASYRIRAFADTLTKEDESPRCRLISPSTYLDVSECT
ncbi:hypothetical protein ACHAW5_008579 [Stephanodiscus triporus]|uniref:Uncharacterized protein n=1 Tax=Stephanodiscus triporus TaxID=2934178 RepID=A0ABD3MN63_9STRA